MDVLQQLFLHLIIIDENSPDLRLLSATGSHLKELFRFVSIRVAASSNGGQENN